MHDDNGTESIDGEEAAPKWTQLSRIERRVVGVLVEKSKTTPDVYPMTVNALRSGSNQKSNRYPKMELENDDIEDVLEGLRLGGAIIEVIGDGRVPKYKHRLYEWMGVEKAELAVMAELLLRGAQTLGDLRARAARMEKSITGLAELKPLVRSLLEKGLMVELTPPGRGQLVTHNLYNEDELEAVRRKMGVDGVSVSPPEVRVASEPERQRSIPSSSHQSTAERGPSPTADTSASDARIEALEKEMATLKEAMAALESKIESLLG